MICRRFVQFRRRFIANGARARGQASARTNPANIVHNNDNIDLLGRRLIMLCSHFLGRTGLCRGRPHAVQELAIGQQIPRQLGPANRPMQRQQGEMGRRPLLPRQRPRPAAGEHGAEGHRRRRVASLDAPFPNAELHEQHLDRSNPRPQEAEQIEVGVLVVQPFFGADPGRLFFGNAVSQEGIAFEQRV